MAKPKNHKGFKEWYEQDEWGEDTKRRNKKTSGKGMSKQDKIKKARREKNKMKQEYLQ